MKASDMEVRYCPVCGEVNSRVILFPTGDPDHPGVKKCVEVMCRCRRESDRKTAERIDAEERMTEIAKLRRLSLMDRRLQDVTFKTYKVTDENGKYLTMAKSYVANFGKMLDSGQGILFYGNVGTGKSFTAAAIANELLMRRRSVIMTSFIRLLEEMMKFKEGSSKNLTDKLNAADLLIVDDLGAERGTDFALEKVYDIIDSRYRSKKPMIMTTNLELGYMQQCDDIRYSRIYDRIFEMCYPVKVAGTSWRKAEAVKRFDEMKKMFEA